MSILYDHALSVRTRRPSVALRVAHSIEPRTIRAVWTHIPSHLTCTLNTLRLSPWLPAALSRGAHLRHQSTELSDVRLEILQLRLDFPQLRLQSSVITSASATTTSLAVLVGSCAEVLAFACDAGRGELTGVDPGE